MTCLLSLYQTLEQTNFPGELERSFRSITSFEVIALTIFNIIIFYLVYMLYIISIKRKFLFSKKVTFSFIMGRSHKIFFVILVLQIIFLLITGVGRVSITGDVKSHPLSFIFSILKPDSFILIYYVLVRVNSKFKTINKLFLINISLFFMLKLLQGWSSFILIFFFLEMYCKFYKKPSNSVNFYVFLIPLIVIFFGGWLYQYVYVIKNTIRGNLVEDITYVDGVLSLSSRLSMNPTSLGAYQNVNKISKLAKQENITLKESKSLLRPIVPSFFFDKNYRNLNNSVVHSYTATLTSATSSDFGIMMYSITLYKTDLTDFTLYIILLIVLLLFVKFFLDSLCNGDGSLDFIFFLILFKVAYTSTLENVFGQGFIPSIYFTLLFIVLGGISFNKRT